jgi:hypothetical protein
MTGTFFSYFGMVGSMDLKRAFEERKEREALKLRTRANYWRQRTALALIALREADPQWEAWYNDPQNLPDGPYSKFIPLVEVHANYRVTGRLYRNVLVWQDDKSALVLLDAHWAEFDTPEAAKRFIDRAFELGGSGFCGKLLEHDVLGNQIDLMVKE